MQADLHKQESIIVAARRGGKTHGMARKIAWDLYRHPGARIFVYNPSEVQSDILFSQTAALFRQSPILKKYVKSYVKGKTLTIHEEPNESTLTVLKVGGNDGGRTSRGFGTAGPCGYIVADESNAQGQQGQTIADNLEPFILAGGGLVYMSSAGEATETNFFYRTWKYYSEAEAAGSKRYRAYRFNLEEMEHLDKEILESQKQKYIAQNRYWVYEREVLSIFNKSQGQFFVQSDIDQCYTQDIRPAGRLDRISWALDPGGRDDPCVIVVGRLNQLTKRTIEVVDARSFIFRDKKKPDDGHEIFDSFEEIVDVCCKLRQKYPPSNFLVDPNCEYSLSTRLKEQFRFPIKEYLVGGYNQKTAMLADLKRALANKTILFSDQRIYEQLTQYSPPVNTTTGKFIYESGGQQDYIVCLGMLVSELARPSSPYIVDIGSRKIW